MILSSPPAFRDYLSYGDAYYNTTGRLRAWYYLGALVLTGLVVVHWVQNVYTSAVYQYARVSD
jgi:hypothetical protein